MSSTRSDGNSYQFGFIRFRERQKKGIKCKGKLPFDIAVSHHRCGHACLRRKFPKRIKKQHGKFPEMGNKMKENRDFFNRIRELGLSTFSKVREKNFPHILQANHKLNKHLPRFKCVRSCHRQAFLESPVPVI